MKTKTIKLTIPKNERIGQAIMNAFRRQWTPTNTGARYWDIWEYDEKRLQEALDKTYVFKPKK